MSLKKRQEHHTQLCKELNKLGTKIEVNMLTQGKQLKIEVILINKIV